MFLPQVRRTPPSRSRRLTIFSKTSIRLRSSFLFLKGILVSVVIIRSDFCIVLVFDLCAFTHQTDPCDSPFSLVFLLAYPYYHSTATHPSILGYFRFSSPVRWRVLGRRWVETFPVESRPGLSHYRGIYLDIGPKDRVESKERYPKPLQSSKRKRSGVKDGDLWLLCPVLVSLKMDNSWIVCDSP